jgi:hypothetical protein
LAVAHAAHAGQIQVQIAALAQLLHLLQKARTIRYGKIFCKGSLCCAYLMKY